MRRILADEIISDWDRIAAILAPAVATDVRGMAGVRIGLLTGDMMAWAVPGGVLVTAIGLVKGTDRKGLWALYAAGVCRGGYGPLMAKVEALARCAGCAEVRIEGRRARQWARVLGGFEHVGGNGDDAVYRRRLDG